MENSSTQTGHDDDFTLAKESEYPWERLQGETDRAFEAFLVYRDMGAARSTAKVAQELGKSKALMDRWCSRWRWVRRVRLYAAHEDHLRRERLRVQRLEMVERHARYGQWMQAKAAQLISSMSAEHLTIEQARRYMETGVRVERDALGAPALDEATSGRDAATGPAGDWQSALENLSDEELQSLIRNPLLADSGPGFGSA